MSVAGLLFLLCAYLLTSPGNRSEAEDAFWYASVARAPMEQGSEVLHPFHPLYFPLIRATYLMTSPFLPGDPHRSLVLVHALVGATSAILFFGLLRTAFTVGRTAALAGAVLFAFSYGQWRYSVEVETPPWTVFMSLLALKAAFGSRSRRQAFLTGVLAALSILVHVLNAVLACTALPLRLSKALGRSSLVPYGLGVALPLALACMVLASIGAGGGELQALKNRIEPSLSGVAKVMIALGQAVVSGNFLWGHPQSSAALQTLLSDHMVGEEIFMGENAPRSLFFVSLATITVLVATAIALLRTWIQTPPPPSRPDVSEFWLWGGSYAVLLLGLDAANPEPWVPGLVPLWTLVTVRVLSPLCEAGKRGLCLALGAALLLHNLVGGMTWIRNRDHDYNYVKASWLLDNATPNDLIVCADNRVFSRYLSYWTQARVRNVFGGSDQELARLHATIDEWDGNVYVLADVVTPPEHVCVQDPGFCERLRLFVADLRESLAPIARTAGGEVYVVVQNPKDTAIGLLAD